MINLEERNQLFKIINLLNGIKIMQNLKNLMDLNELISEIKFNIYKIFDSQYILTGIIFSYFFNL